MHYLDKEADVIAVYLSDTTDLYPNNNKISTIFNTNAESFGYFPVFDLFRLSEENELRFSNGESTSEELKVKRIAEYSPYKTPLFNNTIRPVGSDLFIAPVIIALNFTKVPVTFVDQDGFRKTLRPVATKNFSAYEGNIYIFTMYTFNNVKDIGKAANHSNYPGELIERKDRGQIECSNEVLNCLSEIKSLFMNREFKEADERYSSTYKVITSLRVSDAMFTSYGDEAVYIKSKRILLSKKDIVQAENNPSASNSFTMAELKKVINENSINCYINDAEDKITDRYTFVAGKIIKINKVKKTNLPSGLYVIITNENGKLDNEMVYSLDDLDKCDFIFRTQEEAEAGGDKKSLREEKLMREKNQFELDKLEAEKTAREIKEKYELEKLLAERAIREAKEKHEIEKLHIDETLRRSELELKDKIHRMNIEANEQKLRHERELSELRRRMEEESRRAAEESYRYKNEYERNKYSYDLDMHHNKSRYEEARYERDSFVETIKTVGAVAGVAAAGILLYKKLT